MNVGTYCAIMAVLADKEASESDRMLGLVSALTGKTTDELLDEPLEEWRRQTDAASFVSQYPAPHKVQEAYTLGGVRYIPTLLERKMTAGQFIDFNEYEKRAQGDDLWAEVLSVILVPEGKTYGKGYDIGDVQEAIRAELCILDAIALRAFFLASCGLSAASTLPSLAKAMKTLGMAKKERRRMLARMRLRIAVLMANGAGWRTLTRWLKLPAEVGTLLRQDQYASS